MAVTPLTPQAVSIAPTGDYTALDCLSHDRAHVSEDLNFLQAETLRALGVLGNHNDECPGEAADLEGLWADCWASCGRGLVLARVAIWASITVEVMDFFFSCYFVLLLDCYFDRIWCFLLVTY